MTRRLAGKVAMITGAASGIAASVTTGNPDDIAATTERIASISPLGSAGVPDDIAAAALSLAGDDATSRVTRSLSTPDRPPQE